MIGLVQMKMWTDGIGENRSTFRLQFLRSSTHSSSGAALKHPPFHPFHPFHHPPSSAAVPVFHNIRRLVIPLHLLP